MNWFRLCRLGERAGCLPAPCPPVATPLEPISENSIHFLFYLLSCITFVKLDLALLFGIKEALFFFILTDAWGQRAGSVCIGPPPPQSMPVLGSLAQQWWVSFASHKIKPRTLQTSPQIPTPLRSPHPIVKESAIRIEDRTSLKRANTTC